MSEQSLSPSSEISRSPRVRTRNPIFWRALVVIAAASVSFLAVSQLSGPDRFRTQLATESEGDLARILASLSSESNALRDELATQKVQLAAIKNSSTEQGSASAQVQAQLNSLEVLAGTVAVTGPGIEMVVNDPKSQVTYDVLVDAVQELRDAGAEAIAINGRRVGVSSAFTSKDARILLDGIALPLPYNIDAIGPAATMEGGLKIPGGATDTLQALNDVRIELHRANALNLPALTQAPSFSSARPVS